MSETGDQNMDGGNVEVGATGTPSAPAASEQHGSVSRGGSQSSLRTASAGGGRPNAALYSPWRGDLGANRLSMGQARRRSSIGGALSADQGESDSMLLEPEEGAATHVIWGTNVNIMDVEARFKRFLKAFVPQAQGEDQSAEKGPKYMNYIREVVRNKETTFSVNCKELQGFNPLLYDQLIQYPREVIPIFDQVVQELAMDVYHQLREENDPDVNEVPPGMLQVRPFSLADEKPMRDLNPADIDCLVSVSGMVTRASNIIPDMRLALFRCTGCSEEVTIRNECSRIDEPLKCPACQKKFAMQLIHNCSGFSNKQLIKMQENPNAIPEGETPHAVTLFSYDDMVDFARPGDRITVTGIYRALPIRVDPRKRSLKAVYKTYIDLVHIHRSEKSRLFNSDADNVNTAATPATPGSQADPAESGPAGGFKLDNYIARTIKTRQEELVAMSRDPNIYEKLTASLAPSIWEMEDVKKGVLCLLFGGVSKALTGGQLRGDLNVLLVGDPGVSKSQLLTYVNKLAPRGIYTSGRGSSAVGLTAYVTKDPETRDMVLESGALVLSDQGVCCIDEFDKMSDSARSMLHEVMEQQTVSVAKAGIIACLNARTSVLASANPVGSRYNPSLSVVENINLPPTLLSRFDLVYLILDKPSENHDRRLAKHLVSLYYENVPEKTQAVIPMEKLRDYIAFARATIQPVLTDEAAQKLVDNYMQLRGLGARKNVISATPRQLESMIRLSESLARMHLSEVVRLEHVDEAMRLMVTSMRQASSNQDGDIEVDILITGMSAQQRAEREELAKNLKQLIQEQGAPCTITLTKLAELASAHTGKDVAHNTVREALKRIDDNSIVVDWEHGRIRHHAV